MEEAKQDDIEEQAMLFSTLADPTRLRLIKLLCRQRRPGALCVCDLAGLLGVTQSAASQHLRVLKAMGLVKGERQGYCIHYFVIPEALKRCECLLLEALDLSKQDEE